MKTRMLGRASALEELLYETGVAADLAVAEPEIGLDRHVNWLRAAAADPVAFRDWCGRRGLVVFD